jgi:hypothetical protein
MIASEPRTPPYASYRSFERFIAVIKSRPLPERVDQSLMPDLNHGTWVALVGTLKSLDLVNDDGSPTNRLKQFVQADPAKQKSILASMLKDAFPYLWNGSFDLEQATSEQLAERIRNRGAVSGATLQKAVRFLVRAASDAGLTLSPLLFKRAGARANGPIRRPKRAPKARARNDDRQLSPLGTRASADPIVHLMNKFPTFDPAWSNELKTKWFEGFGDLMRQVTPTHPRKGSVDNTEK